MRIALVQPPHFTYGKRLGETFKYEVPLGVLALHASLGEKHAVSILNLNFQADARKLRTQEYDLVGIRCTSMDRDYVIKLTRELKKKGKPVIVAGGVHATLCPEDLLGEESIDYVVRGAGEEALPRLAEALEAGKGADAIEGVAFRRGGKVRTGKIAIIRELDRLPLPSYGAVDLNRYLAKNNGSVMYEASRGCMHRCLFCSLWKMYDRIYAKSIPTVLRDVEAMVRLNENIQTVNFIDNTFNFSRQRVLVFCRGIKKVSRSVKRKISWIARVRADNLDEGTVKVMKESGMKEALMGFESANLRSLRILRRGNDLGKMIRSVEYFLKYGISAHVSFQLGLPWEKPAEMWKTVKLAVELENRGVFTSLCKSTPFPGTDIARYSKSAGSDSSRFFSFFFPYENDIAYRHPHASSSEIEAMLRYYRGARKLKHIAERTHPVSGG